MTAYNPSTFKYTIDFGTLPLDQLIRVLRAMQPKYQNDIVGIQGHTLGLNCKDEKTFTDWVEAWVELTGL